MWCVFFVISFIQDGMNTWAYFFGLFQTLQDEGALICHLNYCNYILTNAILDNSLNWSLPGYLIFHNWLFPYVLVFTFHIKSRKNYANFELYYFLATLRISTVSLNHFYD